MGMIFICDFLGLVEMKKYQLILSGIAVGLINSLFGAGGGIVAVPILKKNGLSQKEAQATAVSIILPLTTITAIIYYFQGNLIIKDALQFIPLGFLGALVGAFVLNKTNNKILTISFALFMIWAGLRMVFK